MVSYILHYRYIRNEIIQHEIMWGDKEQQLEAIDSTLPSINLLDILCMSLSISYLTDSSFMLLISTI